MRQTRSVCGFLFVVACLSGQPLAAQTVYRCANAYSQAPCPGATLISVDDSRTPQQKAQTDAAAAQAARSADQMEKDRLARERAVARVSSATPVRSKPASATVAAQKQTAKKKNQEPDMFTAFPPPEDSKTSKKQSRKPSPP